MIVYFLAINNKRCESLLLNLMNFYLLPMGGMARMVPLWVRQC